MLDQGAARDITIRLRTDGYGYIYHRGVKDGYADANTICSWDTGLEWYDFRSGTITGLEYAYDTAANEMIVNYYGSSKITYTPEKHSDDGIDYWYLDDKNTISFNTFDKYTGFAYEGDGKINKHYFGREKFTNCSYEGQYFNGDPNGLGILLYEGFAVVGDFVNGEPNGYCLILYDDADADFAKWTNGELETIKKIIGLKIDIDILRR
jgi:hypothetical protein